MESCCDSNLTFSNKAKTFIIEDDSSSDEESQGLKKYRTECFVEGSYFICKDKEELKYRVASTCRSEDNTIIRTLRNSQKRIDWVCYFHFRQKVDKFPSMTPKEPCPFVMNWRPGKKNDDKIQYFCKKIIPYHNHPRFFDDDLEKVSCCMNLPVPCRNEALNLHKQGLSTAKIHELLSDKFSNHQLSSKRLKNFICYDRQKSKKSMDCETYIKNHLIGYDTEIVNDSENQRIFVNSKKGLEMWNNFKDVLLVDNTYCVHNYFKSAILIITVDMHGSYKLLALALSKCESDENYIWTFNKFKEQGFSEPQTIITHLNNVQYRLLQSCFCSSTVIFGLLHVIREFKACLVKIGIEGIRAKDKFLSACSSETKLEFNILWAGLIDEFPVLEQNLEFMNLQSKKEKWAKYSVKKFFTVGLNSLCKNEALSANIKKMLKMVVKESNLKVFLSFEEVSKRDEKEINLKTLNIKDSNSARQISKIIDDLQSVHTNYCLLFIAKSLRDADLCYLHSNPEDNVLTIEDQSSKQEKMYEVNLEHNLCSCNKHFKYKIPCSHLLFACQIKNLTTLDFIATNTARRWLLPQNGNKPQAEILRIIKRSAIKRKNSEKKEE